MSTPEAHLVEKLRGTASAGYDEWRVQDPQSGAYCIAYWWPDHHNPEHEARRWLETEKVKYPNGRFANYVVACVRVVPLKDRLLSEAADTIERLTAENANLRTVMIAAAEEIQAHWDAHCDAEGYGPANLMRRLEQGIPAEHGYTAGAFARLTADHSALLDTCRLQTAEVRGLSEQVAALTAERDALVRQNLAVCDAMGYSDRKHEMDSPEEYAARLLFERDALLADAARLDWFADHVLSVRDEDWRRGREEWTLDSDSGLYRGDTIREAIDNAMRAALQQPKEPSNV